MRHNFQKKNSTIFQTKKINIIRMMMKRRKKRVKMKIKVMILILNNKKKDQDNSRNINSMEEKKIIKIKILHNKYMKTKKIQKY